MTNEKYRFSSSLVSEIARLGGDLSGLIPPAALNRMKSHAHS
jgi:phosphopantetheine adenylyltransferase